MKRKTTEEDLGTFFALRERAREENSPLKNDLHMFIEYIAIVAMPKHLNKKRTDDAVGEIEEKKREMRLISL